MATPTIHVRVTEELLARAERLVPFTRSLPESAVFGRLSVAKVCRLAMSIGLDALEERLLLSHPTNFPRLHPVDLSRDLV